MFITPFHTKQISSLQKGQGISKEYNCCTHSQPLLWPLSDKTGSRDIFWDQNGLETILRPNVTLPRVTRAVSRPFSRPKWSLYQSRDQYRHKNVTLCFMTDPESKSWQPNEKVILWKCGQFPGPQFVRNFLSNGSDEKKLKMTISCTLWINNSYVVGWMQMFTQAGQYVSCCQSIF